MRPVNFSLTYPAAVANAIATAQQPLAAGFLTLTASPYTLSAPAYVTITSVADETAVTFTIVGADPNGNAQTEVVAGGNATTVTSTNAFSKVVSVYASAATTGNITVGNAQAGYSKAIPVDTYQGAFNIGVSVEISGTVLCSIQHTLDDIQNSSITPVWFNHWELVDLTVSGYNSYNFPISAIRLITLSGGGTTTVNVIQSGMPGK